MGPPLPPEDTRAPAARFGNERSVLGHRAFKPSKGQSAKTAQMAILHVAKAAYGTLSMACPSIITVAVY